MEGREGERNATLRSDEKREQEVERDEETSGEEFGGRGLLW
jgi:hypothetical protein